MQKSRVLLKLNGKKERWDVWENIKVDYESVYTTLVLKTGDFEEERLLRFAEETEVEDLGVVGVLRNDDFVEEWLKLKIKIDLWDIFYEVIFKDWLRIWVRIYCADYNTRFREKPIISVAALSFLWYVGNKTCSGVVVAHNENRELLELKQTK